MWISMPKTKKREQNSRSQSGIAAYVYLGMWSWLSRYILVLLQALKSLPHLSRSPGRQGGGPRPAGVSGWSRCLGDPLDCD